MKQLSIIGLSNAGKTCYIYAMAKTMINGFEGLNIIAKDDDLRDQLRQGWRGIRHGSWPQGSDKVTMCEFDCSLFLNPIMDFCWEDFKGGSLTSMNEIDKKFRNEFNEYLCNSDGLLLFVGADMLQDILKETDEAEDYTEDLEVLTALFLRNKGVLSRIPVTVVITKSDLLSVEEKEFAIEIVKEVFKPLFMVGNNIEVLVAPVCIGQNLGRGEQGSSVSGVIFHDPQEGNIHMPIVFNLYHFLKDCISVEKSMLGDADKAMEERRKRLRTAEAHNGLQRWWNSENVGDLRDSVNSQQDVIRKKKEKIKELESQLDKVERMFSKNCQYYVNGSLVNF